MDHHGTLAAVKTIASTELRESGFVFHMTKHDFHTI